MARPSESHLPTSSVAIASAPPAGLEIGTAAPAFTLPDLSGTPRSLNDWLGQPLLLVFLDPAGPCSRDLVAHLARLTARTSRDPLPIVVTAGDVAANLEWFAGSSLACPVLVQEGLEVAAAYRVSSTPMGYRIDGNGRILSPLATGASDLLALATAEESFAPAPVWTPRWPASAAVFHRPPSRWRH